MQLFFTIKLQHKIFIVSFFSIMESSFKKEAGGEQRQVVVVTEYVFVYKCVFVHMYVCACVH